MTLAARMLVTFLLFLADCVFSQTVQNCLPPLNHSNTKCVEHYAAILPAPFSRAFAVNGVDPDNDTFADTSVPLDPSFSQLKNSSFIVFEPERAAQILGPDPHYDFVFDTRNDSIHEAPVYVPALNAIIYSLPHQGIYQQQIIYLNGSKPSLQNYTSTPPVYAVNGGKYFNGSVYWASEASFPFPSPTTGQNVHQAPGLYLLDPISNQTKVLLNNYFGTLFNSPNDLWVDRHGDIWFTDSWYGYAINVTSPPVLPARTWRFRPTTGRVSIVEDTLQQPNGIGMSPDGRTLYLTDTGITDFAKPPPPNVLPRYTDNPLLNRAVYAFDVVPSPAGDYLANKRAIWFAEEFADDGFHVSKEGYLIGAAGRSIDVLSPEGELLVKIQTGFPVNNVQFDGTGDLWLFGMGGIARVHWGLKGMIQE